MVKRKSRQVTIREVEIDKPANLDGLEEDLANLFFSMWLEEKGFSK